MLTCSGYQREVAIAGALFLGALLPIALREHGYQAWSWFEAITFPIAVILSLRYRSVSLFAILIVLASLNRETSLFLPLIPLAVAVSNWGGRDRNKLIAMSVVGFSIAIVIRLFLMFVWPGPTNEREISIEMVRESNSIPELASLARSNVLTLLGALVVCAVIAVLLKNVKRENMLIAILTIPPLLTIYLYYALLWEVRVLLPVAILILPISLGALFKIRNIETKRDKENTFHP
jgi:hypothetical protein